MPRQVCDNLQALCGSLEGSEVPAALLEGAVLTRESMQAALERRGETHARRRDTGGQKRLFTAAAVSRHTPSTRTPREA